MNYLGKYVKLRYYRYKIDGCACPGSEVGEETAEADVPVAVAVGPEPGPAAAVAVAVAVPMAGSRAWPVVCHT